MKNQELSAQDARTLSLRQLGVDSVQDKTVLDVVNRLGLLQIDSVNVFERAHYMPLFSRLGNYPKSELDNLMGGFHPTLIEYWAHEASIIPLANWPLYRWRMDAYRDRYENKWGMQAKDHKLVEQIRTQLKTNGPMSTNQFETEANQRKGTWWGWSELKSALEYMFLVGDLVSGGRDSFKRLYALPDQVLPQHILDHLPDEAEAKEQLMLQAAKAFGVATYRDLCDWHRMKPINHKQILQNLLDKGLVEEVKVEGWLEPGYVAKGVQLDNLATKGARTTILSPFDPVCWNRDRIERMWGYNYRIEIYTPEPKRIFGYYTLPILHDRKLVGRIDLKSDRKPGNLLAKASWHEENLKDREVQSLAKAMTKHLKEVQTWQGLSETIIEPKGNLAELLC
ncbi:MAG: winged helix DNA-binding domain-containing protein [Rhodoluna sp.]|nr:winged helix DNA-binding domain-containing protein [Rhodoluna sp.]